MPILADYHLHSSFSGDSDIPMERMIERGIAIGMETMCFTEHMDMDYPYKKEEESGLFDLDTAAYVRGIARCTGDSAPFGQRVGGLYQEVQF